MNRREFLRRAISLAPALVVVPPAVTYFLAPRGGWPQRSSYWGLTDHQLAGRAYNELMLRRAERLANPPIMEGRIDRFLGIDFVEQQPVEPGRVWQVYPAKWDEDLLDDLVRYGGVC